MPMLRIETNRTRCQVPKDFHKTTTDLVAKLLEKPPERVGVSVMTDQIMSRAGSTEPCAFATLLAIGGLGEEENKHLSAALSVHIERYLGVSRKRLLIHFIDESPTNLGNCGTTYVELLKSLKPEKPKKEKAKKEDSSSESEGEKKKKGKDASEG